MFGVFVIGLLMVLPAGQAADMSKAKAAEYILATAKAARTVYVKGVIADAKKAGVKLSEDWVKDDHSIMLPAQFIKELGAKITDFELSLIGTDPLYLDVRLPAGGEFIESTAALTDFPFL